MDEQKKNEAEEYPYSALQIGAEFTKISSNNKKIFLSLCPERKCLKWKTRKNRKCMILVSSITEIRHNACPENTNENRNDECCIEMAYGQPSKKLHLHADSPTTARKWALAVRALMDNRLKAQEFRPTKPPKLTQENWVRQTFEQADKNGDGKLNMEEIMMLMRKLNINLSKRKAKKLFQEADTACDDSDGYLEYDEFLSFYRKVSVRSEVVELMESIGGNKRSITTSQLIQFLESVQNVRSISEEDCERFVQNYEPSDVNKRNNILGMEGFINFLHSEHCDVIDDEQLRIVEEEMKRPLSQFFINSSHNTYLVGDQLTSHSSPLAYAKALNAGCRCVELDCWDGPAGEPIIHHGYTFTSKISFYDVIKVIERHAFVDNPYPVILSIENHCGLTQQRRMAEIMKDVFGEMLNVADTDSTHLPSPHELRGKILIKCKKLPDDLDPDKMEGEVSTDSDDNDVDSEAGKYDATKEKERNRPGCQKSYRMSTRSRSVLNKNLARTSEQVRSRSLETARSFNKSPNPSTSRGDVKLSFFAAVSLRLKIRQHLSRPFSRTGSSSRCNSDECSSSVEEQPRGCRILSRHLSDLVVYTRSIEFPGFHAISESGFDVWSFSEKRAQCLVSSRPIEMVKVNRDRLSRIYPSSLRVSSSNFNPVYYWNAGCQLVALNHQTRDKAMHLNDSMFELNGGCGYVPKPTCLLQDEFFNPLSTSLPRNRDIMHLVIDVISGQQLPKPPNSVLGERGEIIDPFVEVEVLGTICDSSKQQTTVVDDNGFNPVWNERFEFYIGYPELAFVRFAVWDSDPIGRDFIGQRTVALCAMATGFRHVQLTDQESASLFVKISKTFLPRSMIKKPSKLVTVAAMMKKRKSKQRIAIKQRPDVNSATTQIDDNHNRTTTKTSDVVTSRTGVTKIGEVPASSGAHTNATNNHHRDDVIAASCDVKPNNEVTSQNFCKSRPQRFSFRKTILRRRHKQAKPTSDVIQSQEHEDIIMTQQRVSSKPKSRGIGSYFAKLLGKGKKNKRYFADSQNDVICDDAGFGKKRAKTNAEARKRTVNHVIVQLSEAHDETIHDVIKGYGVTHEASVGEGDPVTSSPNLTSTPKPSVYTSQRNQNNNNSSLNSDQTTIRNQRSNESQTVVNCVETPRVSMGRSRSFSEKLGPKSPRRYLTPRRPVLSVFNPESPPRRISPEQRSVSTGNVNHNPANFTRHTTNSDDIKPSLTEKKSQYYVDMKQLPSKMKCTSLLDLTSKDIDSSSSSTTVSKMIAQKCVQPSITKQINQACNHSTDTSNLANRNINLTSPSTTCNYRNTRRNVNRRPASMLVKPAESDYVMLEPLVSSCDVTNQNYEVMRPQVSNTKRQPVRRPYTNLAPAKSTGSLLRNNPQYENSDRLRQNLNADWLMSPSADYRAEIDALVARLKQSIREKVPDRVPQVPLTSPYYQNRPGMTSLSGTSRSKSVDPLDVRAASPPESSRDGEFGATSRSRSRARNIAKRYSLYNSHDNLARHQAGNNFDDYVYLAPPPIPQQPTRRDVTKNHNYASNDGNYMMTTKSNEFYRLNVIVANSRSSPDGAEGATSRSTYRSLDRPAASNKPVIFYALDV